MTAGQGSGGAIKEREWPTAQAQAEFIELRETILQCHDICSWSSEARVIQLEAVEYGDTLHFFNRQEFYYGSGLNMESLLMYRIVRDCGCAGGMYIHTYVVVEFVIVGCLPSLV